MVPFRLDLTADALRRLSANVVDRFEDGEYVRVLEDTKGAAAVRVRQVRKDALLVSGDTKSGLRFARLVGRMLGTDVDLSVWYRNVKAIPWLERLAKDVRGVKPPRYPTMWEALAHAIVFQQISIHAAGAIMQRMVEAFGTPRQVDGALLYPFPSPTAIADAPIEGLRATGLSVNKVSALQSVAAAIMSGAITEDEVRELPTPQAIVRLSELRGIGPWSATIVLLRGLGRLDAFPLKDSGVASSLRLLSGNQNVDVDDLLLKLGEQRGMLYFHLLLGRIALRRGGLT